MNHTSSYSIEFKNNLRAVKNTVLLYRKAVEYLTVPVKDIMRNWKRSKVPITSSSILSILFTVQRIIKLFMISISSSISSQVISEGQRSRMRSVQFLPI